MKASVKVFSIAASVVVLIFISSGLVLAHCDTLDGPVIAEARAALSSGDVTPVLKWVKPGHEAEIRDLFARVVEVRGESAEARGLADMYFFETLVRLHRAGEGAPYTGLKPAGEVEPIVALSDTALESGDVEELVRHVTDEVASGIRKRFAHASEAMRHKDENIEAGREYVEAYVVFTHYVERLYLDAGGNGMSHGHE